MATPKRKRTPGERSIINRANQAKGQALEEMVETAGAVYERRGLLWIHRLYPYFKVVGNAGNDILKVRKQGTAPGDFFGSLAGGKLIMIECKSRARPVHKGELTTAIDIVKLLGPHQAAALARVNVNGGLALIIYQQGASFYGVRVGFEHEPQRLAVRRLTITPTGMLDWLPICFAD